MPVVKTHKQRLVAADEFKTSSDVKHNLFFSVVFTLLLVVSQPLRLVSRLLVAFTTDLTAVERSSYETLSQEGKPPKKQRRLFKTAATLEALLFEG